MLWIYLHFYPCTGEVSEGAGQAERGMGKGPERSWRGGASILWGGIMLKGGDCLLTFFLYLNAPTYVKQKK